MTKKKKDLNGFLNQPFPCIISYQYAQPDGLIHAFICLSIYFLQVSCVGNVGRVKSQVLSGKAFTLLKIILNVYRGSLYLSLALNLFRMIRVGKNQESSAIQLGN